MNFGPQLYSLTEKGRATFLALRNNRPRKLAGESGPEPAQVAGERK
jgi:hypothetical protein